MDLSAWLDDPEWKKERIAAMAGNRHRIHGLAAALDALKNAGYSREEIKTMVEWILSGRALAGIS